MNTIIMNPEATYEIKTLLSGSIKNPVFRVNIDIIVGSITKTKVLSRNGKPCQFISEESAIKSTIKFLENIWI